MSTIPSGSPPADQPPPPPPLPPAPRSRSARPKDPAAKFTRAGALWSALIGGFLVLILLLVFITQNLTSASFAFLGWHWTLPLGVAILLGAVVGGLITVAAGTVRIVQLRHAAKKNLITPVA